MNTPYAVHGLTTRGRRDHNEDTWLGRERDGIHLLAVADGMGGHEAGDVASRLLIETLEQELASWNREDPLADAVETIEHANTRILEYAKTNPEAEGLGTTLVALILYHGRYAVLHTGDSRAYRLRGSEIQQLTADHSAVQDSIDRGLIDEADAGSNPYRHAILKNLGSADDWMPDIHGPQPLEDGDLFLLCSDGLSGFLSEMEIQERIAATPDIKSAARALVVGALDHGGDDNTTAVLCEIGRFQRIAPKRFHDLLLPEQEKPLKPRRSLGWAPYAIAVLAVLALTMGAALWRLQQPTEPPQWELPQDQQIYNPATLEDARLRFRYGSHRAGTLHIEQVRVGESLALSHEVDGEATLAEVLGADPQPGLYTYWIVLDNGLISPKQTFQIEGDTP